MAHLRALVGHVAAEAGLLLNVHVRYRVRVLRDLAVRHSHVISVLRGGVLGSNEDLA